MSQDAGAPAGRRAGPERAVVLGGSGFMGRHVCSAFAAAGYDVVSVARRAAAGPPGVRDVRLDLLAAPPPEVEGLLRELAPSVVVNTTGAVWDVSARQMEDVNVTLVRRIVAAVGALPVPARLVQLGSVHEYGPVPPGTALREDSPPSPTTVYGRTKLLGSRAVLAAGAGGRPEGVVLRIANVVGPGLPRASLLGRVAAQLSAAADGGTTAELRLSPLRSHRDFVDVRDITEAVVAAARRPVAGRVFNLGRGQAVDVRRMVDGLIEASGIPARVVEEGGEEARSAGVEWQRVDCGAARAALGWVPRRGLAESLAALWEEARAGRGPTSRAS
ncbi:NAD(P)-dependent oxidoreductase [Streptomyces sp. TG1A-8]|uniref:NAD-dependent epimerase/dehydratase family protein n=1 Tax=Streptomyces sp. TG1A-8 TaxID=3051385 RepID=UPI00265C4025|nr:NAD(P)-dependent oxidoreductase [Streptomyces sp. TG1A-8]MDO0926700.1 NAD(P)-dependent oxidoreductase [Streptomyces sp. TG1A-8]